MIEKLGLTKLFWLALIVADCYILIAIYAILNLPENPLGSDNQLQIMSAVKLTKIRLTIAIIFVILYPLILFYSLKYCKYVTITLTAWGIAMYIDDYLVLYRLIEYPEQGLVVFIQSMRPVLLFCLIWMSFELTYHRPKVI